MRPRFLPPLLMLLLAATACSLSPEAKVRDRLMAAGVKPPMARCLAHRLVRKLDADELRSLGRVAAMPRTHGGHAGWEEIADRLRALNDPHIVSVVTRAGIACAISG